MLSSQVGLRAMRAASLRTSMARVAPRRYASASNNAFNQEREAVKHHAAESADIWRKMSIYVAIPCLLIASVNAYRLWNEHWEHESHMPPKEERPQYDYMNIRSKAYPWGNGDKTLFWNDDINYKKE